MIRRDGDILSGIELIRPTYTYTYIPHTNHKRMKYVIVEFPNLVWFVWYDFNFLNPAINIQYNS